MGSRGGSSHGRAATANAAQTRIDLSPVYDAVKREMGEKHAKAIMELLKNASPEFQSLWVKYADKFRVAWLRSDEKGAYFSPNDEMIHLRKTKFFKEDKINDPYEVVFHEFGHAIDHFIFKDALGGNSTTGLNFSGIYGRELLGKTIKAELEERAYKMGYDRFSQMLQNPSSGYSREDIAEIQRWMSDHDTVLNFGKERLVQSILDRGLAPKAMGSLSDMLEGAGFTDPYGDSHPLGAGHGFDYWKRGRGPTHAQSVEAFAEFSEVQVTNSASRELLKEFVPKSYELYLKMLKRIPDWKFKSIADNNL